MCCTRCDPTWWKEQRKRGRQLFGASFQHLMVSTTNMMMNIFLFFLPDHICFCILGDKCGICWLETGFLENKTFGTTSTCYHMEMTMDQEMTMAIGHWPMTITKSPNTPTMWCQSSFTPLGCFLLSLKEALLLFCNRVCLLTAGDCLPTILSALPNQLENIERQNEPEERESKCISVKHWETKREQLFRN